MIDILPRAVCDVEHRPSWPRWGDALYRWNLLCIPPVSWCTFMYCHG